MAVHGTARVLAKEEYLAHIAARDACMRRIAKPLRSFATAMVLATPYGSTILDLAVFAAKTA